VFKTNATSFIFDESNGGNIIFSQSNTAKLTLDTSGNLGLGVTPSAWFSTRRALQVGVGGSLEASTSNYTFMNIGANYYVNTSGTDTYIASNYASRYTQNSGAHQWYTAPSGTAGNAITFTQAMTLDASGNLIIGKTSTAVSVLGVAWLPTGNGFLTTSDSGTQYPIGFYRQGNSSAVGFISTTSSATTYATSSDYRLKNTIAPMTGALAKVALLKPCTYKWNADGSDGEGFIAHELAEVCPQAVTGEKDAVDADGKPIYQGIDTSFLVATLTAALQEAVAEINSLKARLDAANL
jgi:hypothetical protein